VKYYKNVKFLSLGWQPGFHCTGTFQLKVPGNECHDETPFKKILV
jgi:hypothetical protein